MALHDNAPTAWTVTVGFTTCTEATLASPRVFLINEVLWLDSHVYDIWGVVIEFGVYDMC